MKHANKLIRQQFRPSRYSPVGRYIVLLAFMSQVFVFSEKLNGATVFVSKQGDNTTGETWSTSFKTVSSAITAATSGDQIWIASGTYFESINLKPSLSLMGGFIGGETSLNQRNLSINSTTIDGSTANTSVILGATGAVLDGLRVTGGISTEGGGGLRCENARMALRNCRIEDNYTTSLDSAAYGGGILCISSELTLLDSVVAGNRTELLAEPTKHIPVISAFGGGICALQSNLHLEGCTVRGNLTNCSDGSEYVYSVGGGVYAEGRVECVGCVFKENMARAVYSGASFARGGGIGCTGTINLLGCTINENSANVPLNLSDAFGEGGGIFIVGTVEISNTVLWKNRGFVYSINGYGLPFGDSLWCKGNAFIDHSTVFADWFSNPTSPAKIWSWFGNLAIRNSITGTMNYDYEIQSADVQYSNVLNGFPGEGNINLDPQFADPANGDFRLLASSPCIDAGTTTGPVTDILGKSRPVDVPGVGREGPGAYDMGAYEFQLSDLPTPAPTPTITETPTITPTAIMAETPTATPTPTRDPDASWVREWGRYR
ncbi:MAG: hypothetical protein IPI28_18210 [Candidatus Omnitrophica bacterium]|nr:hypothetical protein [Candidatus Omnitrophota bacterium]